MNQKDEITIFSTFALDKLVDEAGQLVREQKGGPALYLSNIFRQEKIPFTIESSVLTEVEIMMTKSGEFGRILKRSTPLSIQFSSIKTPFIVISTLLDEFSLKDISYFQGNIFLDIQGYVRDGKDFGKKKYWNPEKEIIDSIFCLKGTEKELANIQNTFLKNQKQKLLIKTMGKLGCEVFMDGNRYMVSPKSVIKTDNAIGAGDTFFAYFISKFMQSDNMLRSVNYAVEKTSEFLSFQGEVL